MDQNIEPGTVIHTNDDGSKIVWDGTQKVSVPSDSTATPQPSDADEASSPAEEKAEIAFADMSPREHRKAAFHLTVCPMHGAAVLLSGMSTGNVSAVKVENLTDAKERMTEALSHIEAALAAYTNAET